MLPKEMDYTGERNHWRMIGLSEKMRTALRVFGYHTVLVAKEGLQIEDDSVGDFGIAFNSNPHGSDPLGALFLEYDEADSREEEAVDEIQDSFVLALKGVAENLALEKEYEEAAEYKHAAKKISDPERFYDGPPRDSNADSQ